MVVTVITAPTPGSISIESGPVAAENLQKLSGTQIRAKVTGMRLSDEMHWRYVYDRDGTLRIAPGRRPPDTG
jgi:hypothetical protein